MNKAMLLAILLHSLAAPAMFSMGWAADKPQTHRKRLDQPTEIQGYPCAKGYAWLFADGKLSNCIVRRDVAFGEATIPAGSWITLLPDGTPRIAQLKRDAKVAGVICMGGDLLGPSEEAMTAFYRSGKLEGCYLAGDQMVQGVPCMNGGIFGDGQGTGVGFYESGKLKSCKLTKDYGGQHKGDRVLQAP